MVDIISKQRKRAKYYEISETEAPLESIMYRLTISP